MRERTATRKEGSDKVCAYLRPPSHPPTSTPCGPTRSTTRENIYVGPTKRQEFYTDLGIKLNRRHGYTLLLYLKGQFNYLYLTIALVQTLQNNKMTVPNIKTGVLSKSGRDVFLSETQSLNVAAVSESS